VTREPTAEELCHERLGARFATALSSYDTTRRVEVLVHDFLAGKTRGARALDVGCGLGFFSEALARAGAEVTACDLGPGLVERTRARVGCEARVADALALEETFARDGFDVVLSSECIEHTPDPARAVASMCAVLKPGGWLALSTPNLVWQPVVRAATALRLRPFDGFENFSTWKGLRRTLGAAGVRVEREQGLHLFPFQLGLHGLSRWCDAHLQGLRWGMINLCVLARKDAAR
jgi:2-polyprenyl-6-hydroxyphenyl methylase/3-demethylubiquinone-9 3-methyltransferase